MKRQAHRKGLKELIKFEMGEWLTDMQKIVAKCYECSSGYDTGLGCTCMACPLVPYNPYNRRRTEAALLSDIQKRGFLHWAVGLSRKLGRTELIKHLKGERLTRRKAIAAACNRCTSGYYLGEGCDNHDCPLIHSNPYVLAEKTATTGLKERLPNEASERCKGGEAHVDAETGELLPCVPRNRKRYRSLPASV